MNIEVLTPDILQIASSLMELLDVFTGGSGVHVSLLLDDLHQCILDIPRHVTSITGGGGGGGGGNSF